ncbi:MAG: hypothetical protein ACXWX9_10470 [Actinomycetota bacterium]
MSRSATTSPNSPQAEPLRYEVAACPIPDEAFCGTAVAAIEALQTADSDRQFALSRDDRFVCARLAAEYFPACEEDDVLDGYALSGPNFLVEIAGERGYRKELDAIVSNVDPSFSDELGNGDVRVIGVGTCGPDVPRRRTYHLAWTAAVSEAGAPAARLLGSFEFTFEDDWRIGLWYLGPLDEWEREQTDPLDLAFCEAGRTPWPAST